MFRQFVLCLGVLLGLAGSAQAGFVTSLDDVDMWVGTGSNRAAFVVDWKTASGTSSFIWGYRWDGTATAEDMLRAITGSNTGLYANLGDFGPGLGFALFGIGFDANHNGVFGVSPTLTFTNGIASADRDGGLADGRSPTDPGDLYREGWWTGYWSYWAKDPGDADWGYSGTGMSGRILKDGSWDGWSFADGFDARPPSPASNPTAVSTPEPSSWVLLVTGAGMLIVYVRRQRAVALA
ncbi:hypothetical protein VT84_36090 [Gemmata sp. SH-PL17]|uniref:PEP-CTERM sorting domain-containing protein n=1 Tax=Gemmata sp. SH-PL17 TaxID=1630693 RepID=UPI00078E2764|nr:PEP-CTERM sorting domain-containing protein [Gemmata sp. SH-PL17]AMV29871.1 hypothetical protein VT84_36090 [Gemmata sp. SH-PL17]